MKCLYTTYGYYRNEPTELKLHARDKAGRHAPITPGTTVLSVTDAGHALTSGAGEVLSRGIDTDVMQIISAARAQGLSLYPLTIGINTKKERVNMDADRFEDQYADIEEGRHVRRYFKAYLDKTSGRKHTAIGVIEYDARNTLSIASLYEGQALSNAEAANKVAAYVERQLAADEVGVVRMINISLRRNFADRFAGKLVIKTEKAKQGAAEVIALAEDAAERKNDVIEVFNEPMTSGVEANV
ncbi:hypothetical protein [Thalassobacillus devorans]|uniref:hypothetical protein n=1 Tax=Thalassobacillus devorans TaxID=279813 RepID=UPI000A1C7EC0|nr:hypothetical protein [Thalassobacillus devorans]